MRQESKGALQRALKAEAVVQRLQEENRKAALLAKQLKESNLKLEELLQDTPAKLPEAEQARQSEPCAFVDYRILNGMHPERAMRLCGVPCLESLMALYNAINHAGAADEIVFYDGLPFNPSTTGECREDLTTVKEVFGGAICHISNAYGGGHTDTEVVELSGLIRKLKEAGFSNGGYSVMADRSFKPLAADLTREGLRYVPRPPKRVSPEEGESNQASAGRTETTAHVCNNVDRAIEALGEWKILGTKLEPADLDLLPMVVDVCGSLINMTCPLITD